MANQDDPIQLCIVRWHQHMARTLEGGFDALLHPDVVFFSPVVFTPQVGRDSTKLYLSAADKTLGGNMGESPEERAAAMATEPAFRYTKEVLDGHHAMLEFETMMDGKTVNDVDIITCDDDSMITEFKVMVRPLQAMNVVHAQMMEMLEQLAP